MDEIVKALIGQAPYAVLLAFMLKRVYDDAAIEREKAHKEIEELCDQLKELNANFKALSHAIATVYDVPPRTEHHR